MLGLAAGAVAADLASKIAASAWLDDGPVRLGAGVTLRLVYNPGLAFGVGARLPAWALMVTTGLAVSGLAWAAWHEALRPAAAGGLVVGGAVANILDRATGGTVVDIFDLGWWPTFNVADICITAGAVVMVLTAGRPHLERPEVKTGHGVGEAGGHQRINTR